MVFLRFFLDVQFLMGMWYFCHNKSYMSRSTMQCMYGCDGTVEYYWNVLIVLEGIAKMKRPVASFLLLCALRMVFC